MTDQAIATRPRDIIETKPQPAQNEVLTPMQMAYRLIQSGTDLGSVKEMLAVSKELAADQARRAFDAALSAAKAEIPPILKNRSVDFTSAKGRTNYRHEDLGEIARTVDPILAGHGLSYRFRTEQQEGGAIRVVCIVAHRDGHAEENALSAGRDESGNKNNIQAIGSTITYLQRYTLKAALGLAASNDDDGKTATKQAADATGECLSDDQLVKIRARLKQIAESEDRFLKYLKVERLEDVWASKFGEIMKILDMKDSGK